MNIAILLRRRPEGSVGVGSDNGMVAAIQAALPEAQIRIAESADGSDLLAQGFLADIAICPGVGKVCPYAAYLAACPDLKWIHNPFSGCESLLAETALKERGVLLTNSRGIHGIPMANHVLGAMLYFARRFDIARANQPGAKWDRFMGDELDGKTLGILGMGQIGRAVAQRAKAFNMTVLGCKRRSEEIPFVDEVITNDRMDEVIARSDYLVMLTPASPETYKLMNADKFAKMKPGAYFINVGRGQTVDNDALIGALQSGRLGGAFIDAYDPEPMPADCPLWTMDNVLITPHVAADSPMYMTRMTELFLENAGAFLAGDALKTLVEWE